MRYGRWLLASSLTLLLGSVAAAGCGRKGPPLPPVSHVPDAISQIQARRVADDVYVTFVVPAQNVDGLQPADVARVDVFAVTTDGLPPAESFESIAERIASVPVMPPPPDAAAPATSAGGNPSPPTGPVPGDMVTIRETLGAAQLVPKAIAKPIATPPAAPAPVAAAPANEKPDADVASVAQDAPAGPRRYYMAIAVSPRGRSVERGGLAFVAAGTVLDAPTGLRLSHTEESVLVSWAPVPGASAYNVYLDDDPQGAGAATVPPWTVQAPVPLNATALPAPTFSEPVVFGRRRCYRVRALGPGPAATAEGAASRECVTPEDRFPPAPPTEFAALTAKDGITLRWASNTESDLGGYLILRGRSGDAKLQQIATVPPTQTQYLDREVMSGVRYVYAVVAVDSRKPEPNPSAESARDESTAP